MRGLQTWGRSVGDRLSLVGASAPFLGLGLGGLSGALGVGWISVVFLILGLSVSRAGLSWKGSVLVIALAVFARSAFQVVPEFGKRTTRRVSGELVVGRSLTNWSGERVGILKLTDGSEQKVAIQEAESFRAGDTFQIKGSIFRPSVARNPDVFSRLDLWRRNQIEAGVDLDEYEVTGSSWKTLIWRYAEAGRNRLRESVVRGVAHPEAREIIIAVILGETPSSSSKITKAFRNSGALHVFAVSGLHVTMMGGLIWTVLLVCGVSRRQGILVMILGMFAYAMITGGNPPAMRASLMAATFLSAFIVKRRPSLFNALALSAILVLLWNPSQVREIGFQLSYGVIAAISIGFSAAYRWFGKIAKPDPLMPQRLLSNRQKIWLGIRAKVAAILATSLAAWVGSLPWMVSRFGIVTPIAVVASVALIPLTFCILAVGFLATILGAVSPTLGSATNQVNSFFARASYALARGFSEVPFGHHRIGQRAPADWVVFDPADGGGSSFLATGGGAMIDLGNNRKYRQIVRSALRRWDWEPKTVFITHPDGKHSGAINLFEQDFSPTQTYLPVVWSRSPTYREFVGGESFEKRGIAVAKKRYRYHLSGEVSVRVLKEGAERMDTVSDSRSIALKLTWAGWKILVMGDLGIEEERHLIQEGCDLSADILLIGQHQRTYSGSSELLRATGARVVIKSSADYPSRQNPSDRWLANCEDFGIEVFHQGDTGAVLMNFDESELEIRSFLQPKRVFRLTK